MGGDHALAAAILETFTDASVPGECRKRAISDYAVGTIGVQADSDHEVQADNLTNPIGSEPNR